MDCTESRSKFMKVLWRDEHMSVEPNGIRSASLTSFLRYARLSRVQKMRVLPVSGENVLALQPMPGHRPADLLMHEPLGVKDETRV